MSNDVTGTGLPPIRTDLAEAKADLAAYGVTRFSGAMSPDLLARVRARLIEQAAAEEAAGIAYRDNTGEPVADGTNQRLWNLLNKGSVFHEVVTNPIGLDLIRQAIGQDIILFSATANIAGPGSQAQMLHGDQIFAPVKTPYPLLANTLWMLDEFTDENGATRVVPNTHKAMRWPRLDEKIESVPATGPAGTLMVWDGRLWHGTGANRTNSKRHGLLIAYCLPFVRQQENATLSLAPDVLAKCTPEMIDLLGFRTHIALGMVDGPPRDSKSLHGALVRRPTAYSHEMR